MLFLLDSLIQRAGRGKKGRLFSCKYVTRRGLLKLRDTFEITQRIWKSSRRVLLE